MDFWIGMMPVLGGLLFFLLGEFVVWLGPPVWAQVVLTVLVLGIDIAGGLYLFKLFTEG